MIPEGWNICTLGDLGKWGGGGTPSKSKSEFWRNGTIPWVSPKDMGRSYIDSAEDYITPEAVEQSSTKVYPAGSVLVVTRSGILRKKLPVAVATRDVAVNQDLKVLVTDRHASNEYVANFMWCYNDSLLSNCAKDGTTVESIDTGSLLRFPIRLPPLPEQKKIAQILSTWDQAITATERLLENSQQRKKGLMQQLLTGKKRLPGFEGEWDKKPLGVIARVYQPKTISQSSLKEDGYPVYGANGLIGFYDQYNHESEQVAVTCRGSTCGLVNWTQPKSWITGNAMVVNVDDNPEVDKRYLYYVLARSSLDYLVTGSGQPQITGDIKRHEVLLPSITEQNVISEIVLKADQDILQLKKYIGCLKQEKKALMQQLLTGKRRVTVDTEAA